MVSRFHSSFGWPKVLSTFSDIRRLAPAFLALLVHLSFSPPGTAQGNCTPPAFNGDERAWRSAYISWCSSIGGQAGNYYDGSGKYTGWGCHPPPGSPCGKGGAGGTQPNVSTGSTVGDVLNLGANMWIVQNIKNPYTAVFAQNFTQGFLTSLFKNDTPEARRQAQLAADAIRQRQMEQAERARLAEQQRQDALFARLNSQLKLSGNSYQLALKTAGPPADLSLKLSDSTGASGLQLKLGNDSGYGIQGLPGIYVGGPANAAAATSAENSNGLKLKIGDSPAPAEPPTAPGNGIPGLPGIYLNNVAPSQSAQLADAATTLSGNERNLAQDTALQSAQKNPELTAPSDDPFVQDFQSQAKAYNAALQSRQEALQKASEAQGHVQADQTVVDYARGQLDPAKATPQQQEAFQKMMGAAASDEEAAVAARQIFENADARLSIVRENSGNALASLAQPRPVAPSGPVPATSPGAPAGPAKIASSGAASAVPVIESAARPAILATPAPGGAPYAESIEACVARFSGKEPSARPTPTLEELEKQLESERIAFERIAETARKSNELRNDWLKDMRKAAQDVGINALDRGVEGLFDSTKEGLQEAEVELHSEILATKDEAIKLRHSMQETRQAMEAAKSDPARLAALNAQWEDLSKNGITPLLQKRKALEARWESYFKWNRRVSSFNSARDFGAWITDMEFPCDLAKGELSCKNFWENNPIAKSRKGDPNAGLDGLKQVLKFGAALTPYGETWDAVSTFIDLSYDMTTEYLGYRQLRQLKANEARFEGAKAMLSERIDRTNAEISCYQRSR